MGDGASEHWRPYIYLVTSRSDISKAIETDTDDKR